MDEYIHFTVPNWTIKHIFVFKRKLVMGVMSIFYQVLKLSLPQDNERTPA